uniref:Uncharacterized protein n=1 Tax=Setaria italica TaxID=4555 RepID=K3YEH8_SETIT
MPIPRPIRSVAGEGSSRPRALPPIHLPSPSADDRFEPVLRRFEPVRTDSSSSTATPPLKPISAPKLDAGVAAAHRPSVPRSSGWRSRRSTAELAHAGPWLDLARIRQGLVRQLPATTFLSGGFSLEAVVRSLNSSVPFPFPRCHSSIFHCSAYTCVVQWTIRLVRKSEPYLHRRFELLPEILHHGSVPELVL